LNLTTLRQQIYTIGATVSGSNGFYYEEAPEGVSFPYIVYHLVDNLNERIAVGAHTDNFIIQFNIFDKRISTSGKKIASATIEAVALELITKLDLGSISIPNYGTLYFKRTLMTPSTIIEDGNYWMVVVRYQLYITNR